MISDWSDIELTDLEPRIGGCRCAGGNMNKMSLLPGVVGRAVCAAGGARIGRGTRYFSEATAASGELECLSPWAASPQAFL
jgi:hypothetical protein